MLLIAVLAWLLISAWLAPGLNPLLRWNLGSDAETGALLGLVRLEVGETRADAARFWWRERRWPSGPREIYQPEDNGALRLSMPEPLLLRVELGRAFEPATGLRGTVMLWRYEPTRGEWGCLPGEPAPPRRWLPADCQPPAPGVWQSLWPVLAGALALLLAWLGWLALFDRGLRELSAQPLRLRRQPFDSLLGLDRKLAVLGRRRHALIAAEVQPEDWQEALQAARGKVERLVELLAVRLAARQQPERPGALPGALFLWQLPQQLPLALERMLVLYPEPGWRPRRLVAQLKAHPTGQDVLLVISPSTAHDAALLAFASDRGNLCVTMERATLTECLLHPRPQEVLVGLLARQLRVTRISPYQTRGGVTRPAAFFGREQLLARVLHREPGNYLLVGGRQLGKTSLMKAIERRFAEHPAVHCAYLSLRDHRFSERLAQFAGQAVDTPLEDSLRTLAARAGKRRLMLLIDEADLLLREEARCGYPLLSRLRAIADEGLCHFMLAGFWDLYAAVALDFASPMRNFGEVIRLGALEADACSALATEPLARLGVRFAQPALVERLVEACGRRANLIAIACQQALELLGPGQREIDADLLQRCLQGEPLADALAGWSRLSPEPLDCTLDRAIVYRVAQLSLQDQPGLRMADWLDQLDAAQATPGAERVRRAFARLQLAWVLQRGEAEQWHFAVPLQAAQFEAGEVEALLRRELRELSAACRSGRAGAD